MKYPEVTITMENGGVITLELYPDVAPNTVNNFISLVKKGYYELSHTRGVISMARSQHPDSAGSQFFIMHEDGEFLDGQYAAFGKVLEGMDVVDAIAAQPTGAQDRPVQEQKIRTITVDTKGETYPEPTKYPDPYARFR